MRKFIKKIIMQSLVIYIYKLTYYKLVFLFCVCVMHFL